MSLTTHFLGLTLRSPVLVASGPASHELSQIRLAEEHGAGGVVLKTAVGEKFAYMRTWPRPRYKLLDWDKQIGGRSRQFSLYSYEQAYSGTLENYWTFIEACKEQSSLAIIGSIFADAAEDWSRMAIRVEECGADAIELDISSPHRPGGLGFDTTFVAAIRAVVDAVRIPVLVKLAPGPDIVHQAAAAKECGASALTLCNRLKGIDVDLENQRPILHGSFAGVGGPWAKYYTMRYIAEVARSVSISISGTGGIMTGEDAVKYALMGATTFQILSVIMINGWESLSRVNAGIEEYLARQGNVTLDEIRGRALASITPPDEVVRWSGEPADGPRNRR